MKDHEQALRRQGQLAQQLLATRIQLAQIQHGGAGGDNKGDAGGRHDFVGSNGDGDRHGAGGRVPDGGSRGGEGEGGARTDAQQMCRRLLEANAMLMRRLERETGVTDENSDINAH